jgi:putative lipoic acid-binding regulatory protein
MAKKEDGVKVEFNGIQVFSATMVKDRETLGERVTDWMRRNPKKKVTDRIVTQSSDHAFHCVTITLFYQEA